MCPEEYKRLRLIRRRQNADYSTRTDVEYEDIKMEDSRIPVSVLYITINFNSNSV